MNSDIPGFWLQDMRQEVLDKVAGKELYMQYRSLLDQEAGRLRRSVDQEKRGSRMEAKGFSPPPIG